MPVDFFDIRSSEPEHTYASMYHSLKENGVIVVKNIFSIEHSNDLARRTIASLEAINPELDHKKPETWIRENLPPQGREGMLQSLIGHIPPVTETRRDPLLKELFAEMYKRLDPPNNSELQYEDMVASLDGINVLHPETGPYFDDEPHDWAHLDQTQGSPYRCIQGQVVLSKSTAAFRCSPKSHQIFEDVISYLGKEDESSQWCYIPEHAYEMIQICIEEIGGEWQIPIYAPPGSAILWLSSTIHSNMYGEPPLPLLPHEDRDVIHREDPWRDWRLVYYICYRPKHEFSETKLKIMEKRRQQNLTMNHWSATTFSPKGNIRIYPESFYHENIQEVMENPEKVFEKTAGI